MAERIDQPEQAARLAAFADGELPADEAAAVQAHLAAHPIDAARVAAAGRLRQGIAVAFLANTPPPSDALRRRIAELAGADTADAGAPMRNVRLSPWRWATRGMLAVAAVVLLFIGLVTGRVLFGPHAGVDSAPVPAATVAMITHVHVDCSRAPDLHTAEFPKRLGKLAGQLETYLGRPVPYPDLRPIGYEYIGAGPCGNASQQTVHLLYRSTRGPIKDTVSLFVQPDLGQAHMEPGAVYWAGGKDAAHPMIVWRKDGMVFYLVGDADEPVIGAANVMHVRPPT